MSQLLIVFLRHCIYLGKSKWSHIHNAILLRQKKKKTSICTTWIEQRALCQCNKTSIQRQTNITWSHSYVECKNTGDLREVKSIMVISRGWEEKEGRSGKQRLTDRYQVTRQEWEVLGFYCTAEWTQTLTVLYMSPSKTILEGRILQCFHYKEMLNAWKDKYIYPNWTWQKCIHVQHNHTVPHKYIQFFCQILLNSLINC